MHHRNKQIEIMKNNLKDFGAGLVFMFILITLYTTLISLIIMKRFTRFPKVSNPKFTK